MSGIYGAFDPDPEGLGVFLQTGPELRARLQGVVDRMKDAAEAMAPIGPEGDPHRGEYKDSFRAEVDVGVPFKGGPRLIGYLHNDAPHAAAVEYGYHGRSKEPGSSAHHVMARAIDFARET